MGFFLPLLRVPRSPGRKEENGEGEGGACLSIPKQGIPIVLIGPLDAGHALMGSGGVTQGIDAGPPVPGTAGEGARRRWGLHPRGRAAGIMGRGRQSVQRQRAVLRTFR